MTPDPDVIDYLERHYATSHNFDLTPANVWWGESGPGGRSGSYPGFYSFKDDIPYCCNVIEDQPDLGGIRTIEQEEHFLSDGQHRPFSTQRCWANPAQDVAEGYHADAAEMYDLCKNSPGESNTLGLCDGCYRSFLPEDTRPPTCAGSVGPMIVPDQTGTALVFATSTWEIA